VLEFWIVRLCEVPFIKSTVYLECLPKMEAIVVSNRRNTTRKNEWLAGMF